MEQPPPAPALVRLAPEQAAVGLLFLAAGLAAAVLGALASPTVGWLGWAAGSYVSWTAAIGLLVRRRFLPTVAVARRLGAARGADAMTLTRGRAVWVAVLLLAIAAAALGGFTDLATGIFLAAGTTSLATARWLRDAERRHGVAVYFDRRRRLRGLGPLDPRNLWIAELAEREGL